MFITILKEFQKKENMNQIIILIQKMSMDKVFPQHLQKIKKKKKKKILLIIKKN